MARHSLIRKDYEQYPLLMPPPKTAPEMMPAAAPADGAGKAIQNNTSFPPFIG
jgi:hypothetical protein